MLKNSVPLYNGLAGKSSFSSENFTALVRELKELSIDGFPNDGWDDHWARRWEFPMVTSALVGMTTAGQQIMESGSGITPVPFWLADAGLHVTGVDLDGNLDARWKNVKVKKGSVTFAKGDMLNLPFPQDHFDGSYSISAIEHTGNAPRAVEEMFRVTKRGGLVVFTMDIDISNTDSVPADHFSLVQSFLESNGVPTLPFKNWSPAEVLTFTNRTINPQSKSWLGLKYMLGQLGLYKWRDQCIFFYCGRKK